jgi:aryl-alcohol dehydrogenase-like predicted oxidoreductase
MKTLRILQLGRDVSRLGMGSMIFHPDRRELVFELLDRFRALGGNLVDTAACYGGGHSERAFGMYLAERGCRDDMVILDKACDNAADLTPEKIPEAIRGNLERLGVETIDLWVAHRDNPAEPVGGLVEALNAEVAAGRIRAFGGSNWTRQRIDAANDYAEKRGLVGMSLSSPNVCIAIPNEPFWGGCTHAEDDDIAWSAETGIPLFAWSSQGRGFFLEHVSPDNLDTGDLVRVYYNEANFARLARARQMAEEKGAAAIEIALAWVLNLPAPTVALVGPATIDEVESCARAAELELTPEEVAWLRNG